MAPNTEFPLFPFSKFRPYVPFLENKTVTRRDPWARRDAWRNDGFFSIARRRAGLFPGLGLGTAAFAVYLAYDTWYWNQGPGKAENEKWAQWKKERDERLASEHGHHH